MYATKEKNQNSHCKKKEITAAGNICTIEPIRQSNYLRLAEKAENSLRLLCACLHEKITLADLWHSELHACHNYHSHSSTFLLNVLIIHQ